MENEINLTNWRYNVTVFMVYCLGLISYSEYTFFTWPIFDEGNVKEPNDLSRRFGLSRYREFYRLCDKNQRWLDEEYFLSPLTFDGYCGDIPKGVDEKQYINTQLQLTKQKVIGRWLDEGEDIEVIADYIINDQDYVLG